MKSLRLFLALLLLSFPTFAADPVAAYEAGDLAGAKAGFGEVLRINPLDAAAGLLAARCGEYLAGGRPEPWTGVFALDHK